MARQSKESASVNIEEQKQSLRDFILDTESWDKLDKIADKQNIFRILSIEHAEIRHSNFLAWLLDPSGNHKLGDYFLKRFLFEYASNSNSDVDVFDIDGLDLDDSIVYRELYHMDVIVESKQSNMVLVIENKIYADEGCNQTVDYRQKIENYYKGLENKYFVFLTLDEREAQDTKWVPMSHVQILEIVNSCIEKMPKDSRGRYYLEDYEAVLRDMADESNSEIKKICTEIYGKHKAAIDLLVNNIPDSFQKRAEIISNIIEKDKRVISRGSNNSYLRFTLPEIEEKIGARGSEEWVSTKDLVLFEIVNNRDGRIRFIFVIGPSDDKAYRDALYDHLASVFEKDKQKKTQKWKRMYSETHILKEDVDEEQQLNAWFDEFLKTVVPEKIVPVIQSFKYPKEN